MTTTACRRAASAKARLVTGDRLGVVEPAMVLGLKIRAGEQFGQADDVRAGRRRRANPVERPGHVFVLRGRSAALDQGKLDFALAGLTGGIGAHGGFPGANKNADSGSQRCILKDMARFREGTLRPRRPASGREVSGLSFSPPEPTMDRRCRNAESVEREVALLGRQVGRRRGLPSV